MKNHQENLSFFLRHPLFAFCLFLTPNVYGAEAPDFFQKKGDVIDIIDVALSNEIDLANNEATSLLPGIMEKDATYVAPTRYGELHESSTPSLSEKTGGTNAYGEKQPGFTLLVAPFFDTKENKIKNQDPCGGINSANPSCNESFNRHYHRKQAR